MLFDLGRPGNHLRHVVGWDADVIERPAEGVMNTPVTAIPPNLAAS